MKNFHSLDHVLFVNLNIFIEKAKYISNLIDKTLERELRKHEQFSRHETSSYFYFTPFLTAKDLIEQGGHQNLNN